MEAVLQPFVEQRLGGKLRRDRREYRHPTLPMVGHVDFRVNREAEAVIQALGGPARERPILDMKTSLGFAASRRFGEDGSDELDSDVLLQMHGYCLLTGASIAYVAALVPGPELKIYSVQADSEMQDLIEEGVERFWWNVTSDTPPEARNEADARRIWPRHSEGKVLEADSELAAALRALASLKAQIRNLEKQEQAVKNEVLPKLADYEAVMLGDQSLCSYKANKDSQRTDWHLLAEEEFLPTLDPDTRARLLADYTATLPGARVLRLAKSLEAA
jgi:predicted phage-related endonuclease